MNAAPFQTGHIGLNVTDLARSLRFYRGVFGFDLLGESLDADRRFAFLGFGPTLVVTLWQQSSARFSAERPGLHHLSLQVKDVDAVRAVEATLREIGAQIRNDSGIPGEVSAAGQLFFTDPDGIRLEVYALDRPPPPAAAADAAPAPPACGFF